MSCQMSYTVASPGHSAPVWCGVLLSVSWLAFCLRSAEGDLGHSAQR
uniref:Uncharacterized protein n=1 Tax=Anguilla anguilla TaxID=7936 RepID=A0A0E9QRM8_ANGAN